MSNPLWEPALQTTAEHELSQYVVCCAIGHAWFQQDADWSSSIGTPVTLRCERCGSLRRESINALGRVNSRRYIRPDEYRYAKGARPTKGEFRVMMLAARMREQRRARKK